MPDDPISNPGITPTPRIPGVSPETPGIGSNDAQEPKPFSLPPEPLKGQRANPSSEAKPTPMEVARDGGGGKLSPQEILDQTEVLQKKIDKAKVLYQDPAKARNLTQDHYDAMMKVTSKLGGDLHKMAKYTNGEFAYPQKEKQDTVLQYVLKYLNSSQGVTDHVTQFLGQNTNPNVAQLLSVQYAMQRASQKVELLASIIGSSVSGIKTLMSTQLG